MLVPNFVQQTAYLSYEILVNLCGERVVKDSLIEDGFALGC